jgi:hypothetical protein
LKRNSIFIAVILSAVMIGLAACAKPPTGSALLESIGLTAQTAAECKAELRFLQESKGDNYLYIDISGNKGAMDSITQSLLNAASAKKPEDKQFSPEQRSDCEIVLTAKDGKSLLLYYSTEKNLLIYQQRKPTKQGDEITYQYLTADNTLAGLISVQKQNAKLKLSTEVKPFRNMEELKSSIDPNELAESGTELDFEFYDNATPDFKGTSCRIYDSAAFSSVPQDSLLITAYGKSKTGEQVKLSITGIDTNSNYTIVSVSEPDAALDSVDTTNTPVDNAATVKKSAIDPGKWIVFLNENNVILDVILPEDIFQVAPTAQSGATPADTASPQESASATPEASPAPTFEDPGD